MKKYSVLLIFSFSIFFTACHKLDPCDNDDFESSFQDEIEAISTAAVNYGQDPTTQNCNIFKDAYTDYVNALEDWDSCAEASGQRIEWQQALDSARASINDIEC